MSWAITAPDGRVVPWTGLQVGPAVLSADDVTGICARLLGMTVADVRAAARTGLHPHLASPGEPAIMLHSASPSTKALEAARDNVVAGRPPEDWPTILETRSVYLAGADDLLVGRTVAWRVAATGRNVLDVPGPYFYLVHALLHLAGRGPGQPALARLVDWLRAHPRCVVRVRALDVEMRAFLLWLRQSAGLDVLLVEANHPDIFDRWARKSVLHPAVNVALAMPARLLRADPIKVLRRESELAPFYGAFGVALPRLPGYAIANNGADAHSIVEQVASAARLLRGRYGIRLGCFKPAKARGGHRIQLHVPLEDPQALARIARQIMGSGEDYVLEAHADYLRQRITGCELILAPSAHFRADGLADGLTMQFTHGTTWQGNVYVDKGTCTRFGLSREQYALIRRSVADFHRAFDGAGLIMGGIDFGVARVGGSFGRAVLLGMQDLNLSACGADLMRVFLAEARAELGIARETYAATKVISPVHDLDLPRLQALVDRHNDSTYARAITSVPGQWGLIAAACPDPVQAAEQVVALGNQVGNSSVSP